MKHHDTFLELAAAAIDFPLTATERGRLDLHLAGCDSCVRSVAGMHEDTLAMGSLAPVVLPERREAEILGAVLGRHAAGQPLRLLAVAALLGLLLIGTLVAGGELIRRSQDDDLTVVPPLPNQTAEPNASAAPDTSAEPAEDGPITPVGELAWVQVGSLPEGVGGLFAVSSGYVAYAEPGYPTGPSAWFSADGRTWGDPMPLAAQHLNCPGWGPDGDDYAPDAEVRGGSSNGREVVLFGREQLFTDEACTNPGASFRMMTWVSSDGRTWDRSDGFGNSGSEATGAWPTADGWQLVGGSPTGSAIWTSTDGVRWSPAGMEAGASSGVGPPAAAAGSTVVGVPQSPEEDSSVGLSRWDGGSWRPVALPDDCPERIEIVIAPAVWEDARWLISGGTTACTSADLEQWTAASLEDSYPSTISLVAQTRYGLIAVSSCQDRTCDGQFALRISPDGRTWTPLTSPMHPIAIADGPAGVLAAAGDGGIWQLIDTGPASLPEDQPLGTVWTDATIPVVTDRPSGRIEAVTAGGPGFVAVGRGCDTRCEAIVWTSVDGRTWERVPASDALESTLIVRTSGPELGMFDVAAGSPGVVAIGYSAREDIETTIWFSKDGTAWERTSIGTTDDVRLGAVAWTGSRFVIVGEDRPAMQDAQAIATAKARAAVWTSTDGRTWSQVPHTAALDVGGFIDTMEDPASGGMHDVTAGLGGVVAVGSVCDAEPSSCEVAAWTSPDGVTWARVTDLPKISGRLWSVAAEQANQHDADRVPYVAVGTDTCAAGSECPGLVMTSSDGTSWMRQPFEQPGDLQTATLVGDRFLATFEYGPEPVWASLSGTTWAPAAMQGGPGARTDITNPLFAATPTAAVWLAAANGSDDPLAWVSTSVQP